MMNELLDEFDDDIDRINQVKFLNCKILCFFFAFLVVFLIIWGTVSEIDTTISATEKQPAVPNVEVQSNYDSVVEEICKKRTKCKRRRIP